MSTILWLLMTGFLTPLPIYIHIHQYRHTHSDIVTIIYPQWLHSPPPLLPIRHTELILVLWTTSWNIKTFYEDQDITQLLWDTPIRWLLCSLFRKLSQTLFITNLFGSNNIFLYNLCHHMVFSLWDVPTNITLPTHTSTDHYSHTLVARCKVPFSQSCVNITYVILAMQAPKFFQYTAFECSHNIRK